VTRQGDPISLQIYQQNIIQELTLSGIQVFKISQTGPIPAKCDLVWDPGLGMRRIPEIFKNSQLPMVATVHGIRVFSIRDNELSSFDKRIKQLLTYDWNWFKNRVSAIITVSNYGANELSSAINIPLNQIYPIYHGVNHNIFHPNGEKFKHSKPYFLHVAQYQPLKNSERIFSAYSMLPTNNRPDFIAVLPGFNKNNKTLNIAGLHLIVKKIPSEQLAMMYRGALGFLFPSIRETFGLPILEAMACGCPVVTSNKTGCAEISEGASLQVNPESTNEIYLSMKNLIENISLQKKLSEEGMIHVEKFSWKKSGEEHINLFNKVIENRGNS
jgi:glycosyltransferase involved in cell wall biosynthesis